MSEKIDILTLLPGDSPFFIVDTSKNAVPLQRPFLTARTMVAAGGKKIFTRGDNFTILSAGYSFPESFCLASAPVNGMQSVPALSIGLKGTLSGITYYTPNFGLSGIQLPLENYETPLGVYIDVYNLPYLATFPLQSDSFEFLSTLRGIDETYSVPVLFDPTTATPIYPVIGDTYTAAATGSGWTINNVYTWSGTAWVDVTGSATVLPEVSMVGVPSAFNGKKVRLTVFVKILHNIALS